MGMAKLPSNSVCCCVCNCFKVLFLMVLYVNILLHFEECYPTSALIHQLLNWKCDINSDNMHLILFLKQFFSPFFVLEACE